MVLPVYTFLSLSLSLFYCILYLVGCIRLSLDLSIPYLPLFLGCEWMWDSCVNHIPDRDGRGCGRCQTVWFSIFSCRRGRTSRIDFFCFVLFCFSFLFSTSCERRRSACHVSDVQVRGLGSSSASESGSCLSPCRTSSWVMHYVHVCITLRLLVVIWVWMQTIYMSISYHN